MGAFPKEYNGRDFTTEKIFDALGIKVLGVDDNLFWNVELPEGWKIVPTEHSMWSKLVDSLGRERLSIFYKGAFYDRRAFFSLVSRYTTKDRTYDDPPVMELQLIDHATGECIGTKTTKNIRPIEATSDGAVHERFDSAAYEHNEEQRKELFRLVPAHNPITWELE